MFVSEKIVAHIFEIRDELVKYVDENNANKMFSNQVFEFTNAGNEAWIIQLALIDDCLSTIEAILFSPEGSQAEDSEEWKKFMRPLPRLFARLNSDLYSGFSNSKPESHWDFLATHYNDSGPFGGANRQTRWTGFRITRTVQSISCNKKPMRNYRRMLYTIIDSLLDNKEDLNFLYELSGVRAAISQLLTNEVNDRVDLFPNSEKNNRIEISSLNSDSILFDVIGGSSRQPQISLNSNHKAFTVGDPLANVLLAWADMEASAWNPRKQQLEDTRTDWGRAARDIVKNENEDALV